MTNILEMPTALERCATKIKAALNRQDQSREAWITASIDLCIELATARNQFADNQSFGCWCNDNGFGEDVLSHQIRAACIAMGREPEALSATLATTKRTSLEWIHREEFGRVTHARKTSSADGVAQVTGARKTTGPKTRNTFKPKPGTDRAYQEFRAADEAGRPLPTAAELEKKGISNTSTQKGRVQFETEQRLRPPTEPVDPDTFSPSMREKFEATLRMYRKTIRLEVEEEIRVEFRKAWDELFLPRYTQTVKEAERVIASRKGIFNRREFKNILLYCVHSDTWANATEAQRHEATQLLIKNEDVLMQKPAPEFKLSDDLPKTVAEMLIRAAEVKAKRAAERKAAASKKKAPA